MCHYYLQSTAYGYNVDARWGSILADQQPSFKSEDQEEIRENVMEVRPGLTTKRSDRGVTTPK
jgi:hypothetical protein